MSDIWIRGKRCREPMPITAKLEPKCAINPVEAAIPRLRQCAFCGIIGFVELKAWCFPATMR
jgi:hypothetical protein